MNIEHIGIAVKNLEKAIELYTILFPEARIVEENVPDKTMKMVILHGENIKLELMEPLIEDSVIAKFIEKRGEGIHHIAYKVDDIYEAIRKAERAGCKITRDPYIGAEGNLICFLHPKGTFGVLTEFVKPGEMKDL